MLKKYKCEYCGRIISEAVCPFCGAINKFPLISESESETEAEFPETQLQTPEPGGTPTKKRKPLVIKLALCALAALIVFVTVVEIVGLATYNQRHQSVNTYKSTTDPRPDKNGYMLSEEGHSSSDHILEGFPEEHLYITSVGTESEFIIPCSFTELKETYHIMPATQYLDNNRNYSLSSQEVTSIKPLNRIWLYDSYNVLNFCLYNNTEQEHDFNECICDSFSTSDISKITSIRFHGIELMTDIAGILDSFGEPGLQFLSKDFYSIDYPTTYGRLKVSYIVNEDGSISKLPTSITVENCKEVSSDTTDH